MRRALAFAGILAAGIAGANTAEAQSSWTLTGPMLYGMQGHSATVLADGRVLVVGGDAGTLWSAMKTAQLYDPVRNAWSKAAPMKTKRTGQTATLLPDGRVLVAGGVFAVYKYPPPINVQKTAELYDPAANTWAPAARMKSPRFAHTATVLLDGRVLVTGGVAAEWWRLRAWAATSGAEIYDPVTGLWTSAAPMSTPRAAHAATLLPDGRVLVAGGANNRSYWSSAEVYDPATNSWSATGSLGHARYGARAVLLPNGRVLVSGWDPLGGFDATTEIYDPATFAFTPGATMTVGHSGAAFTLLATGQVLIAGGGTASAELYDWATDTWSAAAPMSVSRFGHTTTLLTDGRVLASAGASGTLARSAEVLSAP